MSKLIQFVLLGAAIWFGLRLYRQWKLNQDRVDSPRGQERFERMVRCSTCGVHLPASAVSANGQCGKCSN
ncbi:hypothetical protein DFR24_2544 [Panacagrimonas perspica]|uniref:Uncharacterized protein n=1 Tax=Panacagrimonas perspica TaxID=381431 RepID=A0A4R7P468_9GAMM|nr:hypothetical protein [Panacagrimonas perspica]TDU28179.1 hypothetical protein DFR24_2544 [Panacagrimonas perspica]THD01268.1 hypothetical protein B1810_20460 [Panacagrimonas perspica]